MNAEMTNQLRATILCLHQERYPVASIVQKVGCARSTVYKVIANPGADRRVSRLKAEPAAWRAAARRGELPPAARPDPPADEDAPAEDDAPDPYQDLPLADYTALAAVENRSVHPETAVVRALLRQTLRDLADEAGPAERRRLRRQAAGLVDTLARTLRAAPPADARTRARLAQKLAEISTELTT
jgi:hypothetical protein